jgi:hypothetical protein
MGWRSSRTRWGSFSRLKRIDLSELPTLCYCVPVGALDNRPAIFPNKEVPGMVVSSTFAPSSPLIDAEETRRAADELAVLIARVGSDSVAGLVLSQAQRELDSLLRSAGVEPNRPAVVGPIRIRLAA